MARMGLRPDKGRKGESKTDARGRVAAKAKTSAKSATAKSATSRSATKAKSRTKRAGAAGGTAAAVEEPAA